MEIKIKYEDFKDLEYYLFSLKVNKPLEIKVSFYDSPEVYEYETAKIENFYVIITK